eukprot:6514630-Lingulodinium_polyedra.AAC.1
MRRSVTRPEASCWKQQDWHSCTGNLGLPLAQPTARRPQQAETGPLSAGMDSDTPVRWGAPRCAPMAAGTKGETVPTASQAARPLCLTPRRGLRRGLRQPRTYPKPASRMAHRAVRARHRR